MTIGARHRVSKTVVAIKICVGRIGIGTVAVKDQSAVGHICGESKACRSIALVVVTGDRRTHAAVFIDTNAIVNSVNLLWTTGLTNAGNIGEADNGRVDQLTIGDGISNIRNITGIAVVGGKGVDTLCGEGKGAHTCDGGGVARTVDGGVTIDNKLLHGQRRAVDIKVVIQRIARNRGVVNGLIGIIECHRCVVHRSDNDIDNGGIGGAAAVGYRNGELVRAKIIRVWGIHKRAGFGHNTDTAIGRALIQLVAEHVAFGNVDIARLYLAADRGVFGRSEGLVLRFRCVVNGGNDQRHHTGGCTLTIGYHNGKAVGAVVIVIGRIGEGAGQFVELQCSIRRASLQAVSECLVFRVAGDHLAGDRRIFTGGEGLILRLRGLVGSYVFIGTTVTGRGGRAIAEGRILGRFADTPQLDEAVAATTASVTCRRGFAEHVEKITIAFEQQSLVGVEPGQHIIDTLLLQKRIIGIQRSENNIELAAPQQLIVLRQGLENVGKARVLQQCVIGIQGREQLVHSHLQQQGVVGIQGGKDGGKGITFEQLGIGIQGGEDVVNLLFHQQSVVFLQARQNRLELFFEHAGLFRGRCGFGPQVRAHGHLLFTHQGYRLVIAKIELNSGPRLSNQLLIGGDDVTHPKFAHAAIGGFRPCFALQRENSGRLCAHCFCFPFWLPEVLTESLDRTIAYYPGV